MEKFINFASRKIIFHVVGYKFQVVEHTSHDLGHVFHDVGCKKRKEKKTFYKGIKT